MLHHIVSVFFANYDKRQGKAKRKPVQVEKRKTKQRGFKDKPKHDRWSCKTDDILKSKTNLQWRVNERSQSLSTPNQSFVIELNIPGLLVWSASLGFIRSRRWNLMPRFNQIVSRNFVWRKTNQQFLYNFCKILYEYC